MHVSITLKRVTAMVKKSQRDCDYYPGICLECGKTATGCEPDARDYECKYCHARKVCGAEEILMMIA